MLLPTALRRPLLFQTRCFVRWRSSFSIDPSVRPVAASLARSQPAFAVSSKKITILNEPPEFYALLLNMIRRAERRIFMSSLYVGSAETELIDTLHKALKSRPSLELYFQLDLNRSTRPGPSSTAKLLLPLIQAFPSRVQVSLFRSPSLRGVLAKVVPPRFNEGWGTWHAKIYGVDDEVMISGANLNKSYFTNRQDRYLHFAAQPHLAQYCFDFLQTISTVSYRLLPTSSPASSPSDVKTPHVCIRGGYTLHWPDPHIHPHHIQNKTQHALSTFQSSKKVLHDLTHAITEDEIDPLTSNKGENEDVVLFPIIQAGQFNIREEESALSLLFRHLGRLSVSSHARRPLVDLTSGYFGLYKPYQDLVLANEVDTRIAVASPKANGFYGSKGISGRIPEGYTLLEQRFMRAVKCARRLWNHETGSGVMLSEWERKGWTYHAKGIWVSPTHNAPPVLTLFGSTNLNARSAWMDTELSFVMVVPSFSPSESGLPPPSREASLHDLVGEESLDGCAREAKDPLAGETRDVLAEDTKDRVRLVEEAEGADDGPTMALRLKLAEEVSRIRMYAREWRGGERKVRFWTKVIVGLVKGML